VCFAGVVVLDARLVPGVLFRWDAPLLFANAELFHFGADMFFATLGEAVNTYLEQVTVNWVDWEEK
jgi:hypothetical protein